MNGGMSAIGNIASFAAMHHSSAFGPKADPNAAWARFMSSRPGRLTGASEAAMIA